MTIGQKTPQNFQRQQKPYAEGAKKDLKEIMCREIQEQKHIKCETETETASSLASSSFFWLFSPYNVPPLLPFQLA